MALQITIFEDDSIAVKRLTQIIEKWEAATNIKTAVYWFKDTASISADLINRSDILCFDIEIKPTTGLDAAKHVREYDRAIPIVFITNYDCYSIQGYEANAFRFLKKPVHATEFGKCLDRAQQFHEERKKDYITLHLKTGLQRFPIDEILYIESQHHYCIISTIHGEERVRFNFTEMLDTLPRGDMVQCHRSYIVNCSHIRSIESGAERRLILDARYKTVPYSRTFSRAVMDRMSGLM